MASDFTDLSNGVLVARVAALGAELQGLSTRGGPALLWHGDAAYWGGRAPVLFPIVGRAPQDVVAVGEFRGAMAQHGFARRMVFDLTQAEPAACTHVLRASEATKAAYPFDFELHLSHRLEGATLCVRARVRNASDRDMPFGLGFHPAFLWPLPGAVGPHRVRLDNGAEPALARLSGGLLARTGLPSPFRHGVLTPTPAMFDDDAMIFPEGAGDGLRYGAEGGPALQFRFHNLPNLALWTKPGAPFLCIEPWHGMAATPDGGHDIARRPDSTILPPGGQASFGYDVTVLG